MSLEAELIQALWVTRNKGQVLKDVSFNFFFYYCTALTLLNGL